MQHIRNKIRLVIVLLVAAFCVSTIIYLKDGFAIGGSKNEGAVVIDSYPVRMGSNASHGEILFKANCASCHSMATDLTGPALIGVARRLPSKNFFEAILLNPDSTISHSSYAENLFIKYGRVKHTIFKGALSKQDIEDLKGFLNPEYSY